MTAEVTDAVAPIGTVTHSEGTTMEGGLPSKTKATEKCLVKSSTKEHPPPVNGSCGEPPAHTPAMEAGSVASHQHEETEATTNTAMMTGGGDTPNEPFIDVQTLNQAREIVSHLFNQSRILNECWVQVAQAVSKAISKCSTQLFQPFTTYISDVSDGVEAWHRNVTLICPEMAHCDYDTYHSYSASVREKMNEFFWKTMGPQYSSQPVNVASEAC